MSYWRIAGYFLGLAVVTPSLILGGDSPPVESAQLKSSGLEQVTKKGGVALLGFAWEGEALPFGEDLALVDVATPGSEDLSFSVLGKGGAAVCEGLRQLTVEGKSLKKARLTFRTAGGENKVFRLENLSIERADCGRVPWTAGLVAEAVSAGSTGEKGDRPKKKSKAKPSDVAGPRPDAS